MYAVLMVCTGNICRTPMASGYLNRLVQENDMEEIIDVDSAGTWGFDGEPATELSQVVCAEHDIDVSAHRSKSINQYLIQHADIVLCMTSQQKNDLVQIFPHHKDKIFTLKGFDTNGMLTNYSINDPFGKNIRHFREAFQIISKEVERIWPRLKSEAIKKSKEEYNYSDT